MLLQPLSGSFMIFSVESRATFFQEGLPLHQLFLSAEKLSLQWHWPGWGWSIGSEEGKVQGNLDNLVLD